jgi:hypothetical protein
MFAALIDYLPATRNFLRQIVPPVLATLIAAVLIAGFNRAFSGHLVQPRMAALHSESAVPAEPPRPANTIMEPRESAPIAPVTGILKAPERIFAKENDREAEKDQVQVKIAASTLPPAPAAAPPPVAAPRLVVRKPEPQISEPRIAAAPAIPAPVLAAPAPALTAPPVTVLPATQPPAAAAMQPIAGTPVLAAKPMVTVPDRARPAPPQAAQEAAGEPDGAPAPRPAERFVDSLRPSALFDRMREFGERIEAAGNEILPNIRQ